MARRSSPWQVDLLDALRQCRICGQNTPCVEHPTSDTGGTTGGERERDSERVILLAFTYNPSLWDNDISQLERELAWGQWLELAELEEEACRGLEAGPILSRAPEKAGRSSK